MPDTGQKQPDHTFDREGRRYACWLKTSGAHPLGLAAPARAEWHLVVEGREYALFDADAEDLSLARIGDFEQRVHDWYETHVAHVGMALAPR